VTSETDFIAALRAIATDPEARGLMDDAAVLAIGGKSLILTHDMLVEGIHFLSGDAPEDVAWKLVAVNLSDLAAKGASPVGLLLGYSLGGESDWDRGFARGLAEAVASLGAPLLGGDTVSAPAGAPRFLGLTAIGEAAGPVPSRAGARAGDTLWISGTIGDAGAGLRMAVGELVAVPELLQSYRRPEPRLALGQRLAPLVGAMMDVSDGLLIDAARMAEASAVGLEVELAAIPLSDALIHCVGDDQAARMDAAIAGDDYELLFAAPAEAEPAIEEIAAAFGVALTPLGRFEPGAGLRIVWNGAAVPLPPRLGYEHGI
jgi:thiamine-monophosphate kinase